MTLLALRESSSGRTAWRDHSSAYGTLPPTTTSGAVPPEIAVSSLGATSVAIRELTWKLEVFSLNLLVMVRRASMPVRPVQPDQNSIVLRPGLAKAVAPGSGVGALAGAAPAAAGLATS